MPKQIAIVGSGEDKSSLMAQLAAQGMDDVVIVTPEEATQIRSNSFEPTERYFRIEPLPELNFNNEKPFVCKGLHEYRRVETKEGNFIKVEWICQCGRKTTD